MDPAANAPSEAPGARPPAPRRRLLFGVLLTVGALVLVEGCSSVVLFATDLAKKSRKPLAERAHTRHDPEIGWVSVPGCAVPDLYGPGRALHTNARGFRGKREYADAVPPGAVRAVCLGDSFTLGYGVGDDDAWPAKLEALDPALECPNLGQGGYGIDQAWLWYRRSGAPIEHQAVVLAFVQDDFRRLRVSRFSGYDKPLLDVPAEGGDPFVRNAPVPDTGMRSPWMTTNGHLLQGVRSLELVRRALGSGAPAGGEESQMLKEPEAERICAAVLSTLAGRARAEGRTLLLVHLPAPNAYTMTGLSRLDGWGRRALEPALAGGAHLLDLHDDFEALRGADRARLYIAPGAVDFPNAAGHFTPEGAAKVAERIRARLRELVR